MNNKVEEKFSGFSEKWICQLDDYLQQLRRVLKDRSKKGTTNDQELQALVSKVTQHHKEYYTIKWALAHEDVLPFFSPFWLSSLETAYSWVTGWKPSAVFKIVGSLRTNDNYNNLAELTQEQVRKIERLRLKIKSEEEKVEREMERQQVAIADGKMVELTRLVFRVRIPEEQVSQVEGLVRLALSGVLAGLEKVMKAADCVRLRTLKGILDVLNPLQCVEFLAATALLHIHLRKRGKERNSVTNTSY